MYRITVLLALTCLTSVMAQRDGLAQFQQSFPNVDIALKTVRQVYSVSTGFESDSADVDGVPVTLDLSGQDVGAVFDALARQRSVYVWSAQDGVYDLYPSSQAESLLRVSVAHFSVADATYREVQSALFNLPEVRDWLSQHHAARNGLINSTAAMPPRDAPHAEPKKISLTLSNVQLRSILNQVISKFDVNQWFIAHVTANGQKYVSIDFQ
jgi:hypothetical protein